MEAHFVYHLKNYNNVNNAVEKNAADGLCVVAFFLHDSTGSFNSDFQVIVDHLSKITKFGSSTTIDAKSILLYIYWISF